jgi:hypothetical protein
MSVGDRADRDAVWAMVNAYQASQALRVAADLGIADLLADGPRPVEALAEATGCHAPSLYRLLRALASVGVFAEVDGALEQTFEQTPRSEFLRSAVPGSVRDWARFVGGQYTWSTWAHLLRSVQTGAPAFPELYGMPAWDYRAANPADAEIYNAAMTANAGYSVAAITDSYDFSGLDLLVDVGGGQGILLAAILAANPRLRGILFDQPEVVFGAPKVLEPAGVADRCEVVVGSFFETLPRGAGAYLLKSVLHDWDDASALQILRVCRAAASASSRLLLVEIPIQPGNRPDPARFLDLHMLVMLGGRERTAAEFRDLLQTAGFRLTSILPTGTRFSLLEAVPA